ncbi:unnamed protein product [Urochloa humidicola]
MCANACQDRAAAPKLRRRCVEPCRRRAAIGLGSWVPPTPSPANVKMRSPEGYSAENKSMQIITKDK